MGRRSSSSSSSASSSRGKPLSDNGYEPKSSLSDHSSVVSKLQMLRNFVCSQTWNEADLSLCLRQCGYNVELAAERLMTGQFQGHAKFSNFNGTRTSAFFAMSGASPSKILEGSHSKKTSLTKRHPPVDEISSIHTARKKVTRVSTSVGSSNNVVRDITTVAPHGDSSTTLNACRHRPMKNIISVPLLLCQRWVVGCCTTRNGLVTYKEELRVSNALTGPPVVRFRGYSIDGTLPTNVGAMLTPLLRYDQCSTKLISIKAEGLMEARRLPIGGEVPLSLSIYLESPIEFFQIFEQENESSKVKSSKFFSGKMHPSAMKNYNKDKMSMSEAAFALLQWAQYGDIPEFKPPTNHNNDGDEPTEDHRIASHYNESEQISNRENDDEMIDGNNNELVVLCEDEFDAEVNHDDIHDDSSNDVRSQILNDNANGQVSSSSLPEMDDPSGFQGSVVLRNYQRQALHWMFNREHHTNQREDLERELCLLLEMVDSSAVRKLPANCAIVDSNEGIRCECGPVFVSDQVAKKSMTLEGEVNPVNHPLWHRRFLVSASNREIVFSFYVNELLGTATHRAPNPPKQCVGGILADAMGLGKTVMVLALIMKDKEESMRNNVSTGSTLIVAPLSLIAQWEEELSTKKNLTYMIHYSDNARSTFASGDCVGADVVVTTYGTLQGELQKRGVKNDENSNRKGLLNYEWHRVILDEAHCIKNQTTLACKACCLLKAERRWCVSGTIIQNSLDDVFSLLKFLRHEPWCESGFWKASITSIMRHPDSESKESTVVNDQSSGLSVAMNRVRRLLMPIMLRRTKDSVCSDGTPILTLPPVESLVVDVHFSPAEREFYNLLLNKSRDVFEGFVKAGTALKSWFAIFSLLQRLRQACDHVALTVKSRIDDSDWNAISYSSVEAKEGISQDTLSDEFLKNLFNKFRSKLASGDFKCVEQSQSTAFTDKVANALVHDVVNGEITEECPICLDNPTIQAAVVTPCGHVFCKTCLVNYLKEKSEHDQKSTLAKGFPSINGPCPCCNKMVDTSLIIDLNKSTAKSADEAQKSLMDKTASMANQSARDVLEQALRGAGSAKLAAVIQELHNVWALDPGSKVLIFSQFLGFLDLMEVTLRDQGIPYGRLDGSMSLKARIDVLDDFKRSAVSSERGKSEKCHGAVMLISMKAGGVGINLVAASSVFIVDPWWNAAVEDQCVHRIHRIGQTAKVVRVRKFVVANSVEERIVELQRRKKGVANQVFCDAGNADLSADTSRPTLDDMMLILGN